MWDNWENHMLAEANRSVPMRKPLDIVPGYLDWYLNVGYPFVQNPTYGAAFNPFASMQSTCGISNVTPIICNSGKRCLLVL
ncbi:hypothetical protein ACE6H2_016185 [Prunus campanulata]